MRSVPPAELLLRLRRLAILAHVGPDLAASGGIHGAQNAVKAVMAGACAVQVVSALLVHGPEHLSSLRHGLLQWLEEHEYESLSQMRGSMNIDRCPDPSEHLATMVRDAVGSANGIRIG